MKTYAWIILAAALPSCAYMQTHKNVAEMGCYYEGGQLQKDSLGLFSQDGQWYLSASAAQFKKSYPLVYDSVFKRGDNAPKSKLIDGTASGSVFFPISAGTATVLQRKDGYARLSSLAAEIDSLQGVPCFSLPRGVRHPILAEIDVQGNDSANVIRERRPETTLALNKVLSAVDFVVVDIPGTLAYNVAIPFMAPFVFFYEFISKD